MRQYQEPKGITQSNTLLTGAFVPAYNCKENENESR